MVYIGTCGWSGYPGGLIEYAHIFNSVEINSSFYRIPTPRVASKWRNNVDKINRKFIFTLKVSRIITHIDRFRTEKSFRVFDYLIEIANILRTKFLLFQTPPSFKPSKENIKNVKDFFNSVPKKYVYIFEVRWGEQWTKEIVSPLFKELNLNQAVDPFRQKWSIGDILYYRLHGFGKSIMYDYNFSNKELNELFERVNKSSKKQKYVFFNNAYMFDNAREFLLMFNNML